MLKGIDISEWQGDLDYGLLKQNFDFVFARSSFGTMRTDAKFAANREGLRSTGQLRGWYHYAYPNNNLPEAEAEFAFNCINGLQDGEIFALDFEEQFSNPPDWVYRFIARFQQLSGYKPLLYANLNLIQNYDWSKVIANDNGLWLACWDYNPDGTCPSTPWPVVAIRQYSNKFIYSGKTIDADVFYGDETTFKLYGYKKSSAPAVGVYYKGLDLTNKDSMKAAIDMWDAVVNQGRYVAIEKYNGDTQILKNDIDAKNKALDSANITLQDIKNKYLIDETTLAQDTKKISDLSAELEAVQKQLEAAQSAPPAVNTPQTSTQSTKLIINNSGWLVKILTAVINAIEGK